MKKKRQFIDFDDYSIPLGKRKQAYVSWLMHKGRTLNEAKLYCYYKFYKEIKNMEGNIRERGSHTGLVAPNNYYIIVVNSSNDLELLNCSQRVESSDRFVAEIPKEKWYRMEGEGRRNGIKNLLALPLDDFLEYLNNID